MKAKLVSDIVHEAVTLSTDRFTTISHVIEEMQARGIGSIIIVHPDNTLAGIFTLRDLLRLTASGESFRFRPVTSSMTPAQKMVTVAPQDTIIHAGQLMRQHKIHHIPVLNHDTIVGIITMSDIEKHLLTGIESDDHLDHQRSY